ncbi:hypothetical protein HanRHA438_Chr08g0353621 [Helianthus annuus]|nr:hypothetical protein HanRHA438_Chr08g0353621 [Helianthus annuus]
MEAYYDQKRFLDCLRYDPLDGCTFRQPSDEDTVARRIVFRCLFLHVGDCISGASVF